MKRQVATLCLILMLFGGLAFGSPPPMFTGPTVSDISGQVAIKAYAKTIFLSAISPENCPLTFAIVSSPSHGAISQLNTATGALIYTGNAGYTGTDSFTYHATGFTTGTCTTGSTTSSAATVSLTVVDTRTTINGQLLSADGVTPRVGKVQWRLLQPAATFDGAYVTPGSVVERTLDSSGNYTVSLYSTDGMSPQTFWQLTYVNGASQENYGIYRIPGSTVALTQTALNALKQTTAQNTTAPVSIATTTQVEALTNSVAAGLSAAVASATASATAAAASAATSATAASASAASAAAAADTAHNYDLAIFLFGVSTPSQVIFKFTAPRAFTIPSAGSVCTADTAATGNTQFGVYVGTAASAGTQILTLQVSASATACNTGVIGTTTAVTTGQVIRIIGPASPDATLSNVAFTIKGTVP